MKDLFIEGLQKSSPEFDCAYFFQRCEPYEDIVDEVFPFFTRQQILDMYGFLNFNSLPVARMYHKIYLLFVSHICSISHNVPDSMLPTWRSISDEDLKTCLNFYEANNLFINLDQIYCIIYNLLNVTDQALVLCLYYGMDLYYMEKFADYKIYFNKSDIRMPIIEAGTKRKHYVYFEMPSVFVNIIERACNTNQYITPEEDRIKLYGKGIIKSITPGQWKRGKTLTQTSLLLTKAINDQLKKIGEKVEIKELNMERLLCSGDIYRMQLNKDWEQQLECDFKFEPWVNFCYLYPPRDDHPHTRKDFEEKYKEYLC